MKRVVYLLFITFFIIIIYLAYCISKEMFSTNDTESFLLGTTGISEICTPSMPEYANSRICYDISYIDPTTSETKQTKAKIEDDYYINREGLLEIVPYGYNPSIDKKSYFAKNLAPRVTTSALAGSQAKGEKLKLTVGPIEKSVFGPRLNEFEKPTVVADLLPINKD
jgi:hypothetical protein